jgi:hypothetical protein
VTKVLEIARQTEKKGKIGDCPWFIEFYEKRKNVI